MIYYKDKDLKKHSISRCIIKKKKKEQELERHDYRSLIENVKVYLVEKFE